MEVAGCYAPGGRYPLPSSVLMTALTAHVAGVTTIVVATPHPGPLMLAAAHLAHATVVLGVGGAQAIAALAYGLPSTPVIPCDIIVGPGNAWVTAAKSIVSGSGKCTIDMLAGPSECLVLADASASPTLIAADLLAQAEHDVMAVPILVTTSRELVSSVNTSLVSQLALLSTASVAIHAIDKGFAVLCRNEEVAIAVTNHLSPEHLEVMTVTPKVTSSQCTSYGALFIGPYSAEVFGDYGAGPNHVLPTGGTARYTGGLSVHSFLRIRTWMHVQDLSLATPMMLNAATMARLEGLEGHAKAAEARLTPPLS